MIWEPGANLLMGSEPDAGAMNTSPHASSDLTIVIHLRPTANFKRCMNCGKVLDNTNDKWYYKSKQFHGSPFKCTFNQQEETD